MRAVARLLGSWPQPANGFCSSRAATTSPRERWDTEAVPRSKYTTTETWVDARGHEFTPEQNYCVGGNTKFYGAALPVAT